MKRGRRERRASALLVVGLSLLCISARALKPSDHFTLQDLETAPPMTPGQFAELFERFFYEFSPRVLAPEVFLFQRAGDCDDYAILCAHILGQKGSETRLIHVQLVGENVGHAVCYVTDKLVYLDYNNRNSARKLVKSRPTARDVATSVAASFERNWTSATEFTYSYAENRKRIRWVIVMTDPPERDADRRSAQ